MTAVVVTLGDTEYLATTLAALAAQTRAPAHVLLVDASRDGGAQLPDDAPDTWYLIPAPGARTFGAAVRDALAVRPPTTRWLWLLHDDSAPEPTALVALVRAVEHSPSVAVAGVKQRTWGEPVRLLEVGVTTSRFGRRMTGVDEGEVDQGQLDGRDDVLGVGTAGMFVRTDVWADLGGTDPALGPFLDGLDLSRRARLAGHRVVVVPEAVVRHARASFTGLRGTDDDEPDHRRSFGARRRALLHTQLAWVPLPLVPVVVALALASGAVRSLLRVVTKEPALAIADLTAPLAVLARPGRILAARRAARRTRRLPRRSLRPLQTTWRDVYREHRDRRMRRRESQRVVRAPSELELRELAAITRRRRVALGALVLVLGGVSWWGTSALVTAVAGGARLAGGALAASAPFSSWWSSIVTGWVPGGLGAPGPTDPLLLALAPLAALTDGGVEPLVLLGGILGSGLAAWFAAGAATRSLALRAWAALVWAGAPALLVAQGQGRLGAVLAHTMIPWVALGLARAVGVQRTDVITSGLADAAREDAASDGGPDGEPRAHGLFPATGPEDEPGEQWAQTVHEWVEADRSSAAQHAAGSMIAQDAAVAPETAEGEAAARAPEHPAPEQTAPEHPAPEAEPPAESERWRGSLGAAAGAGLAFAVASAGAPVLLPAGLLVLLVLAVVVPRRPGRVLFVAVPALALHAPVLVAAASGGTSGLRALLGDPGLPLASPAAPVWGLLGGWPVEPADGGVLPEVLGASWPWVTGAVLLAVAVAALVRGREVARGVRIGWWTVAVGLLAAGVSARVEVAAGDGVLVRGWTGPGVSLAVGGLLVAALLGADGARARIGEHTFGWRQPLAGLLAVLALAGPVVQLATWAVEARGGETGATGERHVAALDRSLVPAVGRQAQQGTQSARVLVLAPGTDEGEVRWQLLRGDGPAPTDRSVALAARDVVGPLDAGALAPRDPVRSALDGLVARIAAGSARDVAPALAERAVAIVLLPPADAGDPVRASARARLEGRLDATDGLERIASNETGTVWRVAVVDGETEVVGGAAWAQLVAPDGTRTALDSEGLTVSAPIEDAGPGRLVVLAESADPGWRATLDGRPLRAVATPWYVAFELPAHGGDLEVGFEPADRTGRLVLHGVVLGLTVLLALPVRRRRGVIQ